jgi:hypothetical protein
MAFASSGRSLFAPFELHPRTRNETWLLVTTSAVMKARGTCFLIFPTGSRSVRPKPKIRMPGPYVGWHAERARQTAARTLVQKIIGTRLQLGVANSTCLPMLSSAKVVIRKSSVFGQSAVDEEDAEVATEEFKPELARPR